MPKMVDNGRTKLTWVAGESGIASPSAPTTAELNGVNATDITCLVVSTYEVRADGSDTTNERAVCETADVVSPTIQKYMGSLPLFRQFDAGTGVPEADDVVALFEFGEVGWLVRRTGKPYSTAWTAGDQVEVYKFMVDNPQLGGGTGEGNLKGTVPLFPQGVFDLNAIVA